MQVADEEGRALAQPGAHVLLEGCRHCSARQLRGDQHGWQADQEESDDQPDPEGKAVAGHEESNPSRVAPTTIRATPAACSGTTGSPSRSAELTSTVT